MSTYTDRVTAPLVVSPSKPLSDTAKVLIGAAEIVEAPFGWCRWTFNGLLWGHCAVGAMRKVAGSDFSWALREAEYAATKQVWRESHHVGIMSYNDNAYNGKQVGALLRRAAEHV